MFFGRTFEDARAVPGLLEGLHISRAKAPAPHMRDRYPKYLRNCPGWLSKPGKTCPRALFPKCR